MKNKRDIKLGRRHVRESIGVPKGEKVSCYHTDTCARAHTYTHKPYHERTLKNFKIPQSTAATYKGIYLLIVHGTGTHREMGSGLVTAAWAYRRKSWKN